MNTNKALGFAAKRRIFVRALVYTAIACAIVSATIMALYERADWPWELAISNTLTVLLTFSMTYFIGTKLEQITVLTRELRDLVERDRLTDVATRDFFFDRLDQHGESYGVSLMVDIDHFKKVNDTYGHLTGDQVIRDVAQALRAEVREKDIVCRYGGEEFVIFLHEASLRSGREVAERMRSAIQSKVTQTLSGPVSVTVSVGGALKDQLEHIEEAIRRADECLYRAKSLGRNRTVFEGDAARAA